MPRHVAPLPRFPHDPAFTAHCRRLRDDPEALRRALGLMFAHARDNDGVFLLARDGDYSLAAAILYGWAEVFPSHEIADPDRLNIPADEAIATRYSRFAATPAQAQVHLSLNIGFCRGQQNHVEAAALAVLCERLFPGSVVLYIEPECEAWGEIPAGWAPGSFLVAEPVA